VTRTTPFERGLERLVDDDVASLAVGEARGAFESAAEWDSAQVDGRLLRVGVERHVGVHSEERAAEAVDVVVMLHVV